MYSPHFAPLADPPAGLEPAGPTASQQPEGPIVSLQAAAAKGVWRKRLFEHECEEVEFEGERGSRVHLHSLSNGPQAQAAITFCNHSQHKVRCIWLNFEGAEVPYTVLLPGERKRYRTWSQHAWIVRDLESERRMCLDGAQAVVAHMDGQQQEGEEAEGQQHAVSITEPPLLRWGEGTHCGFPQHFRAEVRALLLCWQRLSGSGGLAPTASSSAAAAATRCGGSSSACGGSSGACGGSSGACSSSTSGTQEQAGAATSLGSLPFELLCTVIQQLAPSDVWQEACAACHPDILPVKIHASQGFNTLVEQTIQQCGGHLPPARRLTADQLLPAALAAPLTPQPEPAPPSPPRAAPSSPLAAMGALLGGLLGFQGSSSHRVAPRRRR